MTLAGYERTMEDVAQQFSKTIRTTYINAALDLLKSCA